MHSTCTMLVILREGLDLSAGLEDIVDGRLFQVDVFAALQAQDRRQRVPMVGGGDGNGAIIFVSKASKSLIDLACALGLGRLLICARWPAVSLPSPSAPICGRWGLVR